MQLDQTISGSAKERVQRLAPDFVSLHWNELGKLVAELPLLPSGTRTGEQLNSVLANILAGTSSLWIVFDENGEIKLCMLCTQGMLGPEGSRALYIEGIQGFADVSTETFQSGMSQLHDYAKSRGCDLFVAETMAPNVVSLAKLLGWTAYPMTKLIKGV